MRLLLIVLPILTLAGCAQNPVTGERDFATISQEQEIKTGREADPQIGEYEDAELQRYVNEVGQKLAKASHRPDLEYHAQRRVSFAKGASTTPSSESRSSFPKAEEYAIPRAKFRRKTPKATH
jgi:hypothetical protein